MPIRKQLCIDKVYAEILMDMLQDKIINKEYDKLINTRNMIKEYKEIVESMDEKGHNMLCIFTSDIKAKGIVKVIED